MNMTNTDNGMTQLIPIIPSEIYARYVKLQQYVGWSERDLARINEAAEILRPCFEHLVDDFYAAIQRNPEAAQVIRGGETQVNRLKRTLVLWLEELVSGTYDEAYVARRWRVGWRHVEIGLEHVYAAAAFSRLRDGLITCLQKKWSKDQSALIETVGSFARLLDLDLAIIQDAYSTESVIQERREERIRAAEALIESEQRYRSLIEGTHDLVQSIDQSGAIIFANRAWRETLGYQPDEISNLNLRDIVHPKHLDKCLAIFERVLGGESLRGVEVTFISREGREIEVIGDVVGRHVDGQLIAAQGIFHNVTERNKAEQRALQAERLAAIGQMITGLAHESRNAFQRCEACLEMIDLELEGKPEGQEMVIRLRRALGHLHHLYEEVRSYAAPIKLDRQMTDLCHIWRDSWSNLELSRREKSVELVEEIDPRGIEVYVDWFAVGQVFRNVLENAIYASPPHGKISVHAERFSREGGDWVRVSFRDHGPGMSLEVRTNVFEPFYTTKTKGTGLGMAIAKRIVEAHDGTIYLGEPSRLGAEIIVEFPCHAD